MTIAEGFLAEFEQELAATRRCLERIPEDKLDWRPHAKSMTLGQLGHHVATTPGNVLKMAMEDDYPLPSFNDGPPSAGSTADLLQALAEGEDYVRATLPALDDARMQATWNLLMDGRTILSMPRLAVIRGIMLNHWYHHRGQLTVYLRLLDVAVPSVYGPSADEPPQFLQQSE